MMINGVPLEIERKFLIRFPDLFNLTQIGCMVRKITQIYLSKGSNGESRRVRISTTDGVSRYTYNEKQRISGFTRSELERSISESEYVSLLSERDKSLNPVTKTRWLLPYDGHLFEIDIFPFWTDRAIMEIELKAENENFSVPPFIDIIREVTFDPAYLNTSLAKSVICERID